MPRLTLPPADKPIGWVQLGGQRLPIYPDQAWLQKLEEIVRRLNEMEE